HLALPRVITPMPELYPLSLHDALPISHYRRFTTCLITCTFTLKATSVVVTTSMSTKTLRVTMPLLTSALLQPWALFITSDQLTRSEEHTSELQSREKLECRRLLDK